MKFFKFKNINIFFAYLDFVNLMFFNKNLLFFLYRLIRFLKYTNIFENNLFKLNFNIKIIWIFLLCLNKRITDLFVSKANKWREWLVARGCYFGGKLNMYQWYYFKLAWLVCFFCCLVNLFFLCAISNKELLETFFF